MDGLALGVDCGTSGLRVAVLAGDGRVLATAGAHYGPGEADKPACWLEALDHALRHLRRQAKLHAVARIAVAGTSGTLVAVDAAGDPVGPASLYNAPAEPADIAIVARHAPADSPARGATSPLARALRLQQRPGVVRLLHQADWIAGRLLGQGRWSDANNALKTGYDPVSRHWPDWLALTGLRLALLPQVVAPGDPLGRLDAQTAHYFGLPPDAVVTAGTTDGCASFLAAGAVQPGEAVTALGSTLTLKLLSDRPVSSAAHGVYSHWLGGRWLVGGASNSGGKALARHFDPAALAALSARIDPTRPSPLDYYPLPAPGERFPIADPTLPPRDTPRPTDDAEFLHGLLEGIARIERDGYRLLETLGAPALQSVRSVGGGAANPAWTAIRARLLGVPLLPALSAEAAVGAARLAAGVTSG